VFLSGGMTRSRASLAEPSYVGTWSAEVNQALLRGLGPSVNLVALRQARNTAAASQHQLRGFVMDLVQQTEDAYWNLVLAFETLNIRHFGFNLAQEQLEENLDFIKHEKLEASARFSAEAAVAARKADLVDAEAALRTRTIELIRLLNPENEAQWTLALDPVDPPETERVDLRPLVSALLSTKYRPELAQARLDLANRDLAVVQTRNGLLPRLDGFASYGRMSSGRSYHRATQYLDDSDFDNYEVGLTFSMAPFNRAERARHRRATFEQQQAEASIRNLEQTIETDVRSAAIEVQRQWERIPATQKEVVSRREELAAERDRFRNDRSTIIDVLLVQQALIQARLEEVTARVRYIQALTALYHAEGTLLDRRGVGTEIQPESQK
jgi:outer membrane protein TolC